MLSPATLAPTPNTNEPDDPDENTNKINPTEEPIKIRRKNNGRGYDLLVSACFKRAMARRHGHATKGMIAVCNAVLEAAENGNIEAAKVVFERIEGKVAQRVDFGDKSSFSTQAEFVMQLHSRLLAARLVPAAAGAISSAVSGAMRAPLTIEQAAGTAQPAHLTAQQDASTARGSWLGTADSGSTQRSGTDSGVQGANSGPGAAGKARDAE